MKYILTFFNDTNHMAGGYLVIRNGVSKNYNFYINHYDNEPVIMSEEDYKRMFLHQNVHFIEFEHDRFLDYSEICQYIRTNYTELFL